MNLIDLRSDTVTQPTQQMREAIYRAAVGDDIMGDDPTIRQLEELTAELFGKEAAMFLPSGTMANQVAVMTYTQRGDEIILGDSSHLFNLECGALAALSQVQVRTVSLNNGVYPLEEMEGLIRGPGIQQPKTALICIENTCDLNAGMVVPLDHMNDIARLGERYNIPVFLDGARIFNASVALETPVDQLTENIDTVMFALTKGLSAPFGAMLVGRKDWMETARWNKQRLGGGFRQAGFLAAAGIVALETMIPRIRTDHENARYLGESLSKMNDITIDLERLHTNILTVTVDQSQKMDHLIEQLTVKNILVKRIFPRSLRMVTHYGIEKEDIDHVIQSFQEITEKGLI